MRVEMPPIIDSICSQTLKTFLQGNINEVRNYNNDNVLCLKGVSKEYPPLRAIVSDAWY